MRTFISGSSSGRAPAAALADNELSRTSSCHQPADVAIEAAIAAHLDRLLCSRCSSPQSMPAQATCQHDLIAQMVSTTGSHPLATYKNIKLQFLV